MNIDVENLKRFFLDWNEQGERLGEQARKQGGDSLATYEAFMDAKIEEMTGLTHDDIVDLGVAIDGVLSSDPDFIAGTLGGIIIGLAYMNRPLENAAGLGGLSTHAALGLAYMKARSITEQPQFDAWHEQLGVDTEVLDLIEEMSEQSGMYRHGPSTTASVSVIIGLEAGMAVERSRRDAG